MRVGLWTFGLIVLGLGLLAMATWQYFSPYDGVGLIVEGPDRGISGCTAGETMVITFRLHNRARHPVQIIGLEPC